MYGAHKIKLGLCPYRFGGGGGSSTSATTTSSTDKRMVIDNGVGVSSDSSTVNVSALDGGAIASAFDFAALAGQGASETVIAALSLADTVYTKGLTALDRNVDLVNRSGDMVAKAYDQAKGSGSEYRMMTVGALALVGVVVFKSFGKK